MTVLLRSIRPSVYNIRQLCGYERCNVHCDGLMDWTPSFNELNVHHNKRPYVLSFSGLISPQQSPQNVSCFHTHTRFQFLVHCPHDCDLFDALFSFLTVSR
jgi:hypothetical protein